MRNATESDGRSQEHLPLSQISARGEWPRSAADIPIFLTQQQYAHLRGVTVRALQRERRLGKSIPFKKQGKQVLYAREDVLAPARNPNQARETSHLMKGL